MHRGRVLEDYIQTHTPFPPGWSLHFIISPGSTISSLHSQVSSCIYKLNQPHCPIHIVFCAGICNLTEKINHLGGTEIWFNHHITKSSSLITELQDMYHDIISLQDHITIQIGTLPPASLSKSSSFMMSRKKLQDSIFSPDHVAEQQKHLETSVRAVNEAIYLLNKSLGMSTITWHKDVTKINIKKGVGMVTTEKESQNLLISICMLESMQVPHWQRLGFMCYAVQ